MTAALRRCVLATLLAVPLAGCSGDAVRTLAADAGYGPRKVDAPDFVTSSRPKETPDFMAVGVDAPRRTIRPKTAEGQRALESELEGARGRNVARGHAAESAGKGVGKGGSKGTAPPADPAAKAPAGSATPPPQ
ncbi:hypothetical protein [Methylobacterium sp. J-076]|uniref:hypothetical protein n=1 Tax=Methylobacterium sp. J-076 TaxID=2836655 RepID=UPI001FBB41E6|nr:hypothetical protein [Methylobacterium sp. J-076]MCJ2011376.1 hypothetical protein [Methylobacterium sp. J-076]